MSLDHQYYSEDIKKIKEIQFCVFSNKEVIRYSSVSNDPYGINLAESYENYEPKKGGLVDLRLGTCDIYLNCTTCGLNSIECPGHFGHTLLAENVFNFGFLTHLKSILQCVCLSCSKLLVENSNLLFNKALNKKSESRYKEIKLITKTCNYCYTCGTPVGKIKKEIKEGNGSIRLILEKENMTSLIDEKSGETIESLKKTLTILTPKDCYNILRNLSDNDCFVIGFNPLQSRPEDLIIKYFPIPPVVIRPTSKLDFIQSATMENSLTLKLSDIITVNKKVRQQLEKQSVSTEISSYNQILSILLQYHVATYFKNENIQLPKSEFKTGNKTIESIFERISGKHGRVRSNLMGKRVNFSGRTVITSDPYINIDEVGIPKKIAMELTIPEEVTPTNINRLSELVKNGKDKYPGANFVHRTMIKDGIKYNNKTDLKYRKKSIILNIGDIVERHAINGDWVLFNRQPTLHKPSMMAHKIHVLNNDNSHTFRVNVSVVKPYNADFDGDEMNIFMAQSIQARNELKRIANVKYQIIGVKASIPIIGCQQDTLAGGYKLTLDNVKIKGSEAINFLCSTTSETKHDLDMDKYYTGHEIFSHIIPKGINNKIIKNDKVIFEIKDGNLKKGILSEHSLGMKKNSIIHFIWDKFGPDKTRRFIDDSQRLVLNYLGSHGLTFSFGDCVLPNEITQQIKLMISNKLIEYKINMTQTENDINQLDVITLEKLTILDQSAFTSNFGPILEKILDHNNNLFLLKTSGAKGKLNNIYEMMALLGSKTTEGHRFKKKVENRTLSCFHRDDDTPEARGFIKSSLMDGLKPYEYFFYATAGREGLIDTAIKSVTWETPIIIIENNKPKYTKIGKWIDELLNSNPDKIKHSKEANMELMETNNIYIPTTDYKGNVSWGHISAITRHDPGNQLYEIITDGGRKVIVTESKSLLIWNKETNEFKEKLTPEINVGDYVPITYNLLEPPFIQNKIIFEHGILELNEENGIFIGLFIGGGKVHDNDICINSSNIDIKNFVKNWLNINKDIISYLISVIPYAYAFEGLHYTLYRPNSFPDFVYTSNNNFIRGLLNGFLSINGKITDYSITSKCYSVALINSLNMLCSRLNIYGKIKEKKYIISNCNSLTLINKNKNDKLLKIKIKTKKRVNDIILEKIVKINLVDSKLHKKMYDLTIPETFNFGIANGLQVRDTAKTGYVQRQLTKGLEDLSIKYDNTNRNAKNVIIQYVYGENGINQSKQTSLSLSLILMNNKDIEENFGFNLEQIKKLEKKHNIDLKDYNKKYIEKIKKYRNSLRIIQRIANNNYKTVETNYMLPVNLYRLTQDYSNDTENLELNPIDINNAIEEFLLDYDTRILPGLKKTDKYLIYDDKALKYLFEISLHEFISPIKCIYKYGLSKKNFQDLLEDIKLNFIKALVEPGEMVGIIAAQSIGEPTTQLSINALEKNKIIIKNTLSNIIEFMSVEIGPFCDNIIKEHPKLTFDTGHVNSVETDLTSLENEYYIIGVDGKEKTYWNKISHISRHPVNGNMMKVVTKSGRIVHTTTSHSHLIRANQTVVPIVGANMKVGMRIPVAKHIDNTFIKDNIDIGNENYKLDYLFGWFVGAYLAEGSISKYSINISNISKHFINNTKLIALRFDRKCRIIKSEKSILGSEKLYKGVDTSFGHRDLSKLIKTTCGAGSFVKRVPDFAFIAPNEFKAGLIQAYFDGDGNFMSDKQHHQIRVCSRSLQLIKDIALLLSYFDMFGSIKTNLKHGTDMHHLAMSGRYAVIYKKYIGSLVHTEKLNNLVEYTERENAHSLSDDIDRINGLGEIIATCGKELNLPGQSRNYGRWKKKESIGRRTLEKYITIFESHKDVNKIINELNILKQAVNSNVIWDEVKEIKIYETDKNDYVYDFTVPGNQTFMTDYGIIVHNTLNTKHSAGIADKGLATTGGLPRLEELLHYNKNIKTPQMVIYFDDNICNDKSKINKIESYFKFLSIKELLDLAEIYYDIGGNKLKNDNVSNPFFINNQKVDISTLPFVFRLKLNIEKMFDKETSLLDIKTKFINYWRNNFTNLKSLKKNEKDILSKISRCAILNNNDNDEHIIHIRFNMSSFNYNMITDFLKIILEQVSLKGIDKISNSAIIHDERRIIFDENTGELIETKEHIVNTSGINIKRLKYFKGINMKRTNCNDIGTVYRLYGIEAARQTLLNEFLGTFNNQGSFINHNHMSVLIDFMTHTGNITSIDRHGLGKLDSEPIAKASFEKTMDHFINAALFNQKDTLKSISSRIMLGRCIAGGTTCFDLLLDTEKLENSEYTQNETSRSDFKLLEEDQLFIDIVKYGIIKFDFFVPN